MSHKIKKDTHIHTSVLYNELVSTIEAYVKNINTQKIIIDGTLGYGGHALGVIDLLSNGDIFIGFDADERNLCLAKNRIQKHKQKTSTPETIFIHSNFGELEKQLAEKNISKVDAVYLDLGVSSLHFDEAERGFTFRTDTLLDMRFDASSGRTAADILAQSSQTELADIFFYYGEERSSKKIAKAIVQARKKSPITTSQQLNNILDSVHPNIKLKTRIYQALRIAVNKELENLELCLEQVQKILKPGGIIFVISFHSLEDRIVKKFLKKYSRDCICGEPVCICSHKKSMQILTKKPLTPTQNEQKENPRSRSAKARIGKKL